jgi:hypothetical protein
VPPRFHDLRHTFATMAIASGVDVKTVSDLLGHANASMTLDVYADALADSKRAGMEVMDGVLSAGAKSGTPPLPPTGSNNLATDSDLIAFRARGMAREL